MRRRYWIALGIVASAVVAAGSAVAATRLESPKARSQAVIRDAAGRLHVSPGALSGALEQALDDQVDAAVAAGRLTKAQGAALRARIDSGRLPLLGRFGFRRIGAASGFGLRPELFGAGPDAVTSYLGIAREQLRRALASGKTLAQIAREHGKTADGLVAALVAAAKSNLDLAVTAQRLSSARERAILARLQALFAGLVNRPLPALPPSRVRPGIRLGFRHERWASPAAKRWSFEPAWPTRP
jgi:hypothetical protein